MIKRDIGEYVAYVHCYAHTLNLMMSDSASVSIDAANLFQCLEEMHVLFSRSQKVHELLEEIQKELKSWTKLLGYFLKILLSMIICHPLPHNNFENSNFVIFIAPVP